MKYLNLMIFNLIMCLSAFANEYFIIEIVKIDDPTNSRDHLVNANSIHDYAINNGFPKNVIIAVSASDEFEKIFIIGKKISLEALKADGEIQTDIPAGLKNTGEWLVAVIEHMPFKYSKKFQLPYKIKDFSYLVSTVSDDK